MIGDINHVIVIESLKDERLTGSELYNDCIRRHIAFQKSDITHSLHQVNSKLSFIELLKYYEVNSSYMSGGILLHIEMHGDENLNGLVLADNSLITWAELIDLFRPINIISNNELYVSIATCKGRYLYQGVNPHQKSPYSCFISASQEVNADEIIDEYSALFESLIMSGNLVKAYVEKSKEGAKFFYKDSRETFEDAFAATAAKFRFDAVLREQLIRDWRDALDKEGLEMPPAGSLDVIVELALTNKYNEHKAAFSFQ